MRKTIWFYIWEFCETFQVPLGKLAPYVFGKMIGRKGRKINEQA